MYQTEDAEALRAILGRRYHVVVGNPPYVTPKDKALNQGYRQRFGSCYRQYSLAVPFTERFFDLARSSAPDSPEWAGFVGMITANSFMKREFGRKLIEELIPRWDITHIVDTAGAYIPGHGTPTVLLFGRNRGPVDRTVRSVMGIRGEPATPHDAAQGRVWLAIVEQIDQPGSQSEFVSVTDVPRERFQTHPWSIGGGGAAELKERIAQIAPDTLGDLVTEIGFGAVTREDEAFRVGTDVAKRHGVAQVYIRLLVAGEEVRNWSIDQSAGSIWPYDSQSLEAITEPAIVRFLWPWRSRLASRVAYGLSQLDRGLLWHEYSMFFRNRFRIALSITFAFVATHNHFVLDRGGKVFKQSAPVIKLSPDATENDHLGLLCLLNSSTACFWGRATLFPKGGYPDGRWQERLEWDGTKLLKFPVPAERPLELARQLDALARKRVQTLPGTLAESGTPAAEHLPTDGEHSRPRDSRAHDCSTGRARLALLPTLQGD